MCRFITARSSLLVAALMLVAGCEGPEGGASAPTAQSAPASDAQPFFVGRWAATEAMCGDAAWSFTPDGLSTPGEVSCTFSQVTATPEGYDIAATCWAEGPPEPEHIQLSYAESARAMLVEGGPFNPVGLVACDGQQP
ncbi:hypothetical protein [Rhodospirillaceae bacterium SYSU D60014]|uniref:hypothetical protein n=1 Tax=Virgifigura deserti TaxID=2268457 RepID=UPI000E668F3E